MKTKKVQAFVKKVPAEVLAAGPADDPVENSSIFHGFLVLPPNQMSSYANDPETSFATRTAPADFNLYGTIPSTIHVIAATNLIYGCLRLSKIYYLL